MQTKIPVGILGATGIVGQRFIQMLEHHPWFEAVWLAASDRSEGKEYAEAARWRLKTPIPASIAKMRVSPATPEGAPHVIFAALDSSIAKEMRRLGFLMLAAATILKDDLFPESARHGHWFWIAIIGFAFYCVGKLVHRFSRDKKMPSPIEGKRANSV